MKNLFLFILFLSLAAIGCKENATPNPNNPNLYGAELSSQDAISLGELYTKLDSNKEVENVKVKAKVETVCQAKGCWMNLTDDAVADKSVFVKFQDYGFFVPKDIAGYDVILEGKAYIEETSVDELRHYAEDEGKSKEEIAAITEPVEEIKFMATGVEVLQPE